jgi:hypothetical protein
MINTIISVFLGFICGLLREFLVVKYQIAVIDKLPYQGAFTTWGIGHLDFIIMYVFISFQNPFMMLGYIEGETIASYLGIKARKNG